MGRRPFFFGIGLRKCAAALHQKASFRAGTPVTATTLTGIGMQWYVPLVTMAAT